MKRITRLSESDLHRLIKKSVKRILKENFNQFSDSDYASTGNPYDFEDGGEQETSLDGSYGTFNNIYVEIDGDNTNNPRINVQTKDGKQSVDFGGEEAQEILDRIKSDISYYGETNTAIFRNLYDYVL